MPKWWTDPPKLIPILISVVALSISCLSWWESHRGRLINEEINRPILSLVKIDPNPVRADVFRFPEQVISFDISIKNIGKSTAELDDINVEVTRVSNKFDKCEQRKDIEKGLSDVGDAYKNVFLLPGVEQNISGNAVMTNECDSETGFRFSVSVKVDYTDVVTNQKYSQFLGQQVDVLREELEQKLRDEIQGPTPKPTTLR